MFTSPARVLAAPALLIAALPAIASPAVAADERPNILLVMVDDMGFSDLGCYGGEIDTPHLDRLADNGLRFTQFYNCAKCETTRATLLSGRYHPEVGIRSLNDCVTIAEALKSGGYTTLMSGKWHLRGNPVERGFDRYFGHLSGACNFFRGDDTFRLDDQKFEVPESGFYTTDANTDYALRFLNESTEEGKPWFLYLAYNAPHYPLHCPKAEFEKYRGRYTKGWDELRRERHARMKDMGLVDDEWPLTPRPADVLAWDSLPADRRDVQELMMAAYAGMIDRVDQNVGRLIGALKERGELDNTLILFLSDNGACPFQRTEQETWDEKLMPYDPDSYWTYDKGWAHACNTPFREYKQNQHEGGISTPLIVHWPKGVSETGGLTHQPGHLVDVMTTCLDVAETEYPSEYEGREVGPARGHSLRPIFEGKQRSPRESTFWTFYGKNNALRIGDWKLVNRDHRPFELYDMAADRVELNDLSELERERFERMKAQWESMAREFGVKRRNRK